MRLPALFVFVLAMTLSANGQTAVSAEDFASLETVWNDAHRQGDAAALERLWSDDLEVNVPKMLPMSKGEALVFARTGRMRFDRYETSGIKIRVYSETAVVTGQLLRTRVLAGRQNTDDRRFTKVYAKQDGRWRVVSFHASDAPSP